MAEFLHNGAWVTVPDLAVRLVRSAALDAARDAVAALSIDGAVWVLRHEALAAIDALRGES